MSQPLLDKVAIVTGASRGLGAATALELATRGADLVLTYNSNKAEAEKIAEQIKSLGREAIIVQATGTDREAPKAVIAAVVQKFGHIDIIVNNAGTGEDGPLEELTHEVWDKLMDTNLRMPVFLMQAAIPYFGPAPRIVNISSVAARGGYPLMTGYAGTKGALESITRVFASELGQKHNLTINCVNPGPIATDMWLRDTDPRAVEAAESMVAATPAAPRIAETNDITPIIAFLADERSRWCTGSVVNANGGALFV